MLTRRVAVTLLIALSLPSVSSAQSPSKWADSIRNEIDAATISGDMNRLHAARALAERALAVSPGDWLLLHYLGYSAYVEAGQTTGRGGNAKPLLDQARDALEKSEAKHGLAETAAVLSSVYGQLIAVDPSQAMSLGMLAGQEMDRAVSLAPTNPRVWIIRGVNAIFAPPEYGGSLGQAETQLTRAIQLFAADKPNPSEPTWGRAEAYAWLGVTHQKQGDNIKAAADFRKALEIAPEYNWVKYVLIPSLQK
jgi:tetratricopeptide (TPR) repeat protein